jgi:hypothetical protein
VTQYRTDTIVVHHNSTDGEFVLNHVPGDLVTIVADDSAVVTTAPSGMVTLRPAPNTTGQLPKEVTQFLRSHVQTVTAKNLLVSYGSADDAAWAVGMMLGHSIGPNRTMAQDRAEHEEYVGLYRHLIEDHHLPRAKRVGVSNASLEELRLLHYRMGYGVPCGWIKDRHAPNVRIKQAEPLAPTAGKGQVLAYLKRLPVGNWASLGRVTRELGLVNRQHAEYLLGELMVEGLVEQNMNATSGRIQLYRAIANRPPEKTEDQTVAAGRRERVLAHMRAEPEKEFILGWLRAACDLGTVAEAMVVLDGLVDEGLVTKQGITNPVFPTNTMVVYRLAKRGKHHRDDAPDEPEVESHPFGYGLGGEPTHTLMTFGRRNGKTEATERIVQEKIDHDVRLYGMAVEYLPGENQPGVRMLIDPTKVVLHGGPIDFQAARDLLEYIAEADGEFECAYGCNAMYDPQARVKESDVVARARKILGYRVQPRYDPGDGTFELVRES